MSKRSYRRLAVVAGAALAVGSMAPAMAQRVEFDGAADVSVDTLDVTDLTGALPPVNGLLPTALVGTVAGTVVGTVGAAPAVILPAVGNGVDGGLCLADAGLGAALGVSAGALAGADFGLGGLTVGLAGAVDAPVAVVGDATACALGLVDGTLDTVGDVQAVAGSAVYGAQVLAGATLATATGVPGTVIGTAGGLLFNDALSSILSISASGEANANVVAGVLSFL